LDKVEKHVLDGRVLEATSLLKEICKGTGASCLAEEWIKDANKFIALQQVRKILLARSQELTVSFGSLTS